MPAADVPAAVVIGVIASLILEAVKQRTPVWFDGAVVTLASFVLTVLVTLGWYGIGGLPEAANWQEAIRVGVFAFIAGQTFYGAGRKVGLQTSNAMGARDRGVALATPTRAPPAPIAVPPLAPVPAGPPPNGKDHAAVVRTPGGPLTAPFAPYTAGDLSAGAAPGGGPGAAARERE